MGKGFLMGLDIRNIIFLLVAALHASSICMEYTPTFNDLVEAVRGKDCERVQELLKDKAIRHQVQINACVQEGRTLMHIAACENVSDIARVLLAAGADPQRRDSDQFSPLDLAISSGSIEIIGVLLEFCPFASFVINQRHPITSLTPLQSAIYGSGNNLPLIRALVEQYAALVTKEDIAIARQLKYHAIVQYLKRQQSNQRDSHIASASSGEQVVIEHAHQHMDAATHTPIIRRQSRLGSFIKFFSFN